MGRFRKQDTKNKEIARERILTLFKEADAVFKKDGKLADRYVELARKLAMKLRIRIPKELKRRFCKHCYSFLKPNINVRIRNRDGKTVYYCLTCKKFMRFPHIRKK